MRKIKIKTTIGGIGRGFILAGTLAVGAGAVLTLVAVSQPSNALAQKSNQVWQEGGDEKPSAFETSARGSELNLSDEQRTQIRAIERESAQREKSLTEQLQMLEQTANDALRGDSAAMQSGLSRARAALQFDLDSISTRTAQEIRRFLTVEQRAVLDAE